MLPPTDPKHDNISITGIGIATCLGLDLETTWRRVLGGECGIGPMPALESPLPPGKDGGQAPNLPADFWPDLPREARYLRWTIEAALRDAAADLTTFDASRVALLLGTTLHGMRAGGAFLRTGDYSKLTQFLAGDTARLATTDLPVGGMIATTCSACSSSLGAIALGVTLLESGEADLVIAGGYDAVSEYAYAGFGALRLISDGPLRPFARERSGMKVAEGYGIVILERRRDHEARGTAARAIVAGWGESADAFHLTRPHPEGSGALAAMRAACCRADITPCDLDLIAAHATGTPDNDTSEAAALTALLGDASRTVPIVGFKSHLGHTLGGAGAVELALSAMAMRDGIVPPTAGGGEVEFSALRITRTPLTRDVRHTLNTSLGFGGANTCVVLAAPGLSRDSQSDARPAYREMRREAGSVVITGIGVVAPGATGNDAFVTLLREGRRVNHRTIADAEYEHLLTNARRFRRMSTYVKLSICAATLAARDANLLEAPALLRDTGAILGTTHGSASFCHAYYSQIVREGMVAANPSLFAEGVPNAAAAQLSLALGLTGSCQTILGTRTAGLDALRLAALRIAAGDAQRVIVCAAEEMDPVLDAAYAAVCEGPTSVSLAVAYVLESAQSASQRGARVLGTLGRSTSVNSLDGEGLNAFAHRAMCRFGASRRVTQASCDFDYGGTFSVQPLLALAAELLSPTDGGTDFVAFACDRQLTAIALTRSDTVNPHAAPDRAWLGQSKVR